MKGPTDHSTDTLGNLGQPIRDQKPSEDKWEHVKDHIWRNTRTGALENRTPLPQPEWLYPLVHIDNSLDEQGD